MAAPTGLIMRSTLYGTRSLLNALLRPAPVLGTPPCRNAARKGTREKARKKKVKVEIQKVGFIPHNQRPEAKSKIALVYKKMDDRLKSLPVDDVYPGRYYQWACFSFEDAIQCHRETHDPSMYNQPKAPVMATLDLDLRLEKEGKFMDKFSDMAPLPHGFDHGQQRSILAFTKDPEKQREALQFGAKVVGGLEIVKEIQNGELSVQDFQFVVADLDIVQELVPIRGLLKRKFPHPKLGTLSADVAVLSKNFRDGVQFSVNYQEHERDYGWVDCQIGTLDMEVKHLRENLATIMRQVMKHAPPRIEHDFLWRVSLKSEPSPERLKIKHMPLLEDPQSQDQDEPDSDDENQKQEVRQ